MAADDLLTLGLRALRTLARRGPLDLPGLATLHGGQLAAIAVVITELERAGLVRRLAGRDLFTVTRRGAALTYRPP